MNELDLILLILAGIGLFVLVDWVMAGVMKGKNRRRW